jgi:antitoxin HicB
MKNKTLQFNTIFRPEPEGGFTVIVPSLPGCITYGKNLKEAQKMAVDAIKRYLASMKKRNEKVSPDNNAFVSLISVDSKMHA